MISATALILFPLLMIFSAIVDLFTMTIPNRISLILVASYVALALYLPVSLEAFAWHVSCGAAILALTFVLFNFRWIGGGDAKLAASTALWLGWEHLLDYGLVASLAGGALTLIVMEMRRRDLPASWLSLDWVARLAEKNGGVPYGVALAFAGLLVYPHTQVWERLTGV